MKNISFLIFLFLFSCSHFNSLRKPAQTELTVSEKRNSLWNSAYRMIMDERPDLYDELRKFEGKLEDFYVFIGKVERGELDGVVSPLKKRGSPFSKMINHSHMKQLSFEQWQALEELIIEAHFKDQYVFSHNDKLYTLWGNELDISILDPYVYNRKKQVLPGLNSTSFLKAFFNHEEFIKIDDDRFYLLPTLHEVSKYQQQRFKEDFIKQTSLQSFQFADLIADRNSVYTLDGFTEYFSAKNYLMKRGELLSDADEACQTKAYVRSFSMRKDARIFLETLVKEKSNLMKELYITNNEYNEMMALAVGILGVESKLGTSFKYKLKEDIRIGNLNLGQAIIKRIKRMRGRSDENSRGLTQIKNIGPLLEDTSYAYLENADLDNPKHAAIATMFVLKEKMGYLMHFRKSHPHIDDYNWSDYLYYFYQGASRQVTGGTATPKKNMRIRKIMQLREKMMIFEKCD